MAISRMQQPRQMYGLGSFVKKAVRKVTKPFTKVAKKIVPKEVAGIMRVAAPFLPPQLRAAAYLLGTAKQTGRISPIDLALVAAPRIGQMKLGGDQTIAQRLGALDVPFTGGKDLREVLVGKGPETLPFQGPTTQVLGDVATETTSLGQGVVDATSGIFGKGGKMFQVGSGGPGILDTKAGQFLLGDKDKPGSFDKAKLAGVGLGLFSLMKDAKTPEEAGNTLAQVTGDSDDYERGKLLFSQLKPELFEVPEEFRMNVKDGGIMRTDYAMGAGEKGVVNPFQPKPQGPVLPEEDKPFKPKPLKPIKMAGGENDRVRELLLKEETDGLTEEEKEELRQLIKTISAEAIMSLDREGIMMAKKGGRANLALGTKPTAEESGLGGLPIEADMRYTGGFMPYGEKEKADDVPARLSKNEFVFTADAVRAAGGGSVNEGAKKMYQAMKQLEAKPEAKGMMA